MKTAVHTKTQAQYDRLMEAYQKKGWRWDDEDNNQLRSYYWGLYKESTCVGFKKCIEYSPLKYYKREGFKIITVDEAIELLEPKEILPITLEALHDELDVVLEKIKNYHEPKEPRTQNEIIIACIKYCQHRLNKHPESGVHKAITKEEVDELDNIIEELDEGDVVAEGIG